MSWERPFSIIEGLENFGLADLEPVLPDEVSAPVGCVAEDILEVIESCFSSVKVYHRYFYGWSPGTDVFHYFFVDPKSKAKTIELWEDLVSRVGFAQEVEEQPSLALDWISRADVTELQWMAPTFFASNFAFGMQDRHFIVKEENKAISQTFLGSTSEFFEQFHQGCQRLIRVFNQNLRIHIIKCILFYQRLITLHLSVSAH